MLLYVFLSFLILQYLKDLVVETLNLRATSTTLPKEFQKLYSPAKYKKSQQYLRETTRFALISDAASLLFTLAFISLAGFQWADTIARSLQLSQIPTAIIFTTLLTTLSTATSLPFSIYSTFVIEQKYGFNKTTPKTFVLDLLKSWLLGLVITSLVLAIVIQIFLFLGSTAWIWAWAALTLVQLFFIFIAPVVIMPLFNKFIPLKKSELRTQIEAFATKQDFKLQGIFTMDGSKRSTKANAFFTGFGRFKRIVLFDTLIKDHTTQELVAVLAHEIGHYKKKHILQTLVLSSAISALGLYFAQIIIDTPAVYQAFLVQEQSIYMGLTLAMLLYSPFSEITAPMLSALSRRNEFQADQYAKETTGKPQDLIKALKKLTVKNLSNLTPHPLKVFLNYSHPPVLDRIKHLQK